MPDTAAPLVGRCYCGATVLTCAGPPVSVAYCHCIDCRRWTGAAAPAFAAFSASDVSGVQGAPFSCVPGVDRWRCPDCGSPLAARFDYLPDQMFVPLGLFEDASGLEPSIHCHVASKLPWIDVPDTVLQHAASARDSLNTAARRAEL